MNFILILFSKKVKRTIYAPSFFGIDQFKKHSQLVQKLQSGSIGLFTAKIQSFFIYFLTILYIDTTRKTIQDAVENNATKIFTDDLKSLLYTTSTDADFELVLKATKK
jgi:hypothetical protein